MPSLLHKQQKLAILIDAENASQTLTRAVIHRAACYGVLAVRRAYADWSRPHLQRHQRVLRMHAVEPVQLFRYAKGKNSADMVLTIDALDLLGTGLFDGICLVSSDSDFTHLAMRIRREGLKVYGFGGRQTPQWFVQACTRFIYVEDLGR